MSMKIDKPNVRVIRSAFGGILQEIALDVSAGDNGDLEMFWGGENSPAVMGIR